MVAEDVQKINPDLVSRDAHGDAYSVRYEQVNAMLLNEFLKEHRKVEQQQLAIARQHHDFNATVVGLKQQIQTLLARVERQDSEIQKVRAQVQMTKAGKLVTAGETR